MAAKSKLKSAVPKIAATNPTECAALISIIGAAERSADALTLEMNNQIADIEAAYAPKIQEAKKDIKPTQKAIAAYCNANRDQLLEGGTSKTVDFLTGKVKWRFKAEYLRITGEEEVIKALLLKRKTKFLTKRISIDRETVKKNFDDVKDIEGIELISDDEEFIIEPNAVLPF